MKNAAHATVSAAELMRKWTIDAEENGGARQPQILQEAMQLGKLHTHPAWVPMVDAVLALGGFKAFESDFWLHDRASLAAHTHDTPFVWCVGEGGTMIVWGGVKRSQVSRLADTLADDRPNFFEWDGGSLQKIDRDRLVELLRG